MFNLFRDKIADRWEVIPHCRSQIIIYSYQILITSSSSIYKSILSTIICNIWVWRIQLIDEHLEKSSATAPIWESRDICTAEFGSFKLSPLVLLPHHAAGSARCPLIKGK